MFIGITRNPKEQFVETSNPVSLLNGQNQKPSRSEAEEAVKTLIRWAGDDPCREGLLETPARVVRSYEEFFSG